MQYVCIRREEGRSSIGGCISPVVFGFEKSMCIAKVADDSRERRGKIGRPIYKQRLSLFRISVRFT